jgi:hypothetical protein
MAYQVRNGDPVAVLHPVFELDGSTPKSGQAANITAVLLKPDMTVSALPVSIVEIGSSGNYTATFTPNENGNWKLTLTNTTGDLAVVDYTVAVSANFLFDVGIGATGLALTTLARVKERLIGVTGLADFLAGDGDNLINSAISEQSAHAHRIMNRIIPAQTLVQYYTGEGSDTLWLRQGPLVDLTLLQKVDYSGSGARVETLTTINESEYVEGGMLHEGSTGRGYVTLLDDVFEKFRPRNYKVTYTCGFNNLPEDIVLAVTDRVIAAFVTRDSKGLTSRIVGENAITPVSLKNADDAFRRALAHWTLHSAFLRGAV